MSNYLSTVPLLLSALFLLHAHGVRANEIENSFQDSVVFTSAGYAGGSTVITNFPLRVDISTARPYGFDYDLAGVNAETLRFNFYDEYVDASTNAVIDTTVNFAITNWNPEGVSTLYVAIPRYCNSSKARLTMYWNQAPYAEIPENFSIFVPPAISNEAQSAEWNQAIVDQSTNENFIACGAAYRMVQHGATKDKLLVNYWLEKPRISKSSWKQGEDPAEIVFGTPASPSPVFSVEYFDRSDKSSIGAEMPVVPGSYSAVVKVAESATYAELTYRVDFEIVSGAALSGVASVESFSHHVEFKMTDDVQDQSLAATIVANDTDGATGAQSSYNYKTELNATGEITLGIWFKFDSDFPTSSNGDAANTALISMCGYGAQQNGPLAIVLDNFNGRGRKVIKSYGNVGTNSTGGQSGADFLTIDNHPWADDQWHFAMATRKKSGEVSLYIDGEYKEDKLVPSDKIFEVDAFYANSSLGNKLSLGCDAFAPTSKTKGFNGWLAEAQVYDRVLTKAEMDVLYNGGKPERRSGSEEGLIAYYPMNEGVATAFNDRNKSGRGVHTINSTGPVTWAEKTGLPFKAEMDILRGQPMLIKLRDGDPEGFAYESLPFGKTVDAFYSDVRFFDSRGRVLDYTVGSWDPYGESFVWVKAPNISQGGKVIMCWGQGGGTELPKFDPSAVWNPMTTEEEIEKLRLFYLDNYDKLISTGITEGKSPWQLQNRWLIEPSFSAVQWKPGDVVPEVDFGASYSGRPTVRYYNRTTGEELESVPEAEIGEYRAVFTCAETADWSEIEKVVDFRIVREVVAHELGEANARVLLANNDWSIDGGEVFVQSYDDNEDGWGLPFWTHHEKGSTDDVSDFDSTKLFSDYNIFPGTCHEYMSGEDRLWGLVNVRFGNLFNNGRFHPGEEGDAGLRPDQNYLPWNPRSERMLGYEGLMVGDYHRYAGTFLLQNVYDDLDKDYAQICSPCYDDGIGTIYFDIVNAFTNNVRDADGNANYAIVVEVATNCVDAYGYPVDAPPVDGEDGIWSVLEDGTIVDAYRYANWQPVEMRPIRFRADTGAESDYEALPATRELELDVTDGGTACNFYRVYVPVNVNGQARFRIRRTRIDEDAALNPDANAFIIVDNLICSPARDICQLVPYGWFDPEKTGKQYLGQEAAFVPPFPGPRDAITARVRALDRNGEDAAPGSVTAVTMHYRWHYLEQRVSKWMYVDFDPTTLTAREPLILPGLPGDIDFWFDGTQNSGYYTYANYSGTKLGVPGYSESFSQLTNGWNGAESEWKIRIREGSSDWESGVLVVREPTREFEIPMELTASHQWRAYYQTTNRIAEGASVRFELRNLQQRGDKTWSWNTNCLYSTESLDELPKCCKMSVGTTNDWAHVAVEATTGYLMFQVDDATRGLTVVRADYQNFNHWSDAHGENFVGSAADDALLPSSGASPVSREYSARYDRLSDKVTSATNGLWMLDFETRKDYTYYKTFPAADEVVNGWIMGKGRFVHGNYRMDKSGTAFQMTGASEGYVEMSDQSLGEWPRGIEKVTFNARLAQDIDFDDFSYADDSSKLKNYAFTVHASFDRNSNKDFTGNASLSLVAYYRRGVGCYEARWEQVNGNVDGKDVVTGPDGRGQRLTIYRWNRNGSGGYDRTELYAINNGTFGGAPWLNFDNAKAESGKSLSEMLMQQMSLAVYDNGDGNAMIVVGFGSAYTNNKPGVPVGTHQIDKWRYAAYLDNSAQKLTSGAYGVLSANCPGYFLRPRVSKASPKGVTWGQLTLPEKGKATYTDKDGSYPLRESDFNSCYADIRDGFWVSVPGRSEVIKDSATVYGFRQADVVQTVGLWGASATGSAKYEDLLYTYTISNCWGTINAKDTFGDGDGVVVPLVWRTRDAKLRLRTGGDLDDKSSPAVVIDDIVIHQWRGKNEIVLYKDVDSPDVTTGSDGSRSAKQGDPDNFVYTSGWINGHGSDSTALELSARRTIPGRPASVRTPLMDGLDGRGSGLGSFGFTYANAAPNVALLVQIATNVTVGRVEELTTDVTTNGSWRTWCRLTYEDLGKNGSTNITFGIRNTEAGAGSIARVIVDPDLVSSVVAISNKEEFGSIELSYVGCQDEPPIDAGCWWGWNVRAIGDFADNESRMYLPDAFAEDTAKNLPGSSLALNNSISDQIEKSKADEYHRHMPFLQSPAFTNDNVIGQVSFLARKYGYSDQDQAAEVALYGITKEGFGSDDWKLLNRFVVSNTVFTAYSFRVSPSEGYCAVRLAVTGVKGVDASERGPNPEYGTEPVRVLFDEVVVSEAVNPALAFRYVGAFRSNMNGSAVVPNVPSKEEQPICGEGWGVQCEVYSVMLEEEIDTAKPPRVKLYWYEGTDVWGYDNWKDLPEAKSAWLERAKGTDELIYRSSYDTCPDAVIPQSKKEPGGIAPVVQYMLEVFYTVNTGSGGKSEERRLLKVKDGEWTVPTWYLPVDYNTDESFGRGVDYSCFCILDDLAPGWAWINEVNILNFNSSTWDNDDYNCQFIEIAAPRDIDLTGWRIDLIEPHEEYGVIYTNNIATFGYDGLSGTKGVNVTSNYVFHVVANPDRFYGDRSVLERPGALDGIWNFDMPTSLFTWDSAIDYCDSFAIRLIRPNGIVEHEIVTVGTNIYDEVSYNAQFLPTGVVSYLNHEMVPANFIYPGQDCVIGDHSVGVVNGRGELLSKELAVNWNNTMRRTPGMINENQQIDPDYPLPNGEMIGIYFDLDQSGGNIWQSLDGGLSFTNEMLRVFLKNGSIFGTNVIYKVEPWYEIEYVKQTSEDGVEYFDVSNNFDRVNRTVELNIGRLSTNRLNIVAKATPDHQLKELGCDEDNLYTPAVIDWLQKGETMHGPFANDDGVLRLAEFWGLHSGRSDPPKYLSLTEMYWLDIDPTIGDMVLQAGMYKPPMETMTPIYDGYGGSAFVTNLKMSVFMMISNKTDNAESPHYAEAWSPYVLRAVEPGMCSTNYAAGTGYSWTSETFKISGILPNGHTSEKIRDNWVDLRWFVFMPDSFYQPSDEPEHPRFTSDIEILDPVNSLQSPGYGAGWYDWVHDPEYPERASIRPFFRWHLDTRLRPFEVEVLKKVNYIPVEAPPEP